MSAAAAGETATAKVTVTETSDAGDGGGGGGGGNGGGGGGGGGGSEWSERPLLWKKRVTVNDWPCLEWNMEKWNSQMNEGIFTFRLYSLDTYFDGRTIHWENEPHATCSATLKQFTEWTSTCPGRSGIKKSRHSPDQGHAIHSPLSNFDRASFTAYSSYNHLGQMLKKEEQSLDGESLDWSKFGLKGDWSSSTLWVGTAGSYTPCHQDTYGFNAVVQLKGKKQWVLFRPSDRPHLYPCRLPYEESSVFSSVNILSPDLTKHPHFAKAQPFIVTLEPGDMLIVPRKWFHFVQAVQEDSQGACVSVNAWQPVTADHGERLKESLVKFLVTALIPTYEVLDSPDQGPWLNTKSKRSSNSSGVTVDEDEDELESSSNAFHLVKVALNLAKGSTERGSQGEEGHKAKSSTLNVDDNDWLNLGFQALQASSETLVWRLNQEGKKSHHHQHQQQQYQLSTQNSNEQMKPFKSLAQYNNVPSPSSSSSHLHLQSQSQSHSHSHSPMQLLTDDLNLRSVIEAILDDQVIEVITRKLLQEKGEKEVAE